MLFTLLFVVVRPRFVQKSSFSDRTVSLPRRHCCPCECRPPPNPPFLFLPLLLLLARIVVDTTIKAAESQFPLPVALTPRSPFSFSSSSPSSSSLEIWMRETPPQQFSSFFLPPSLPLPLSRNSFCNFRSSHSCCCCSCCCCVIAVVVVVVVYIKILTLLLLPASPCRTPSVLTRTHARTHAPTHPFIKNQSDPKTKTHTHGQTQNRKEGRRNQGTSSCSYCLFPLPFPRLSPLFVLSSLVWSGRVLSPIHVPTLSFSFFSFFPLHICIPFPPSLPPSHCHPSYNKTSHQKTPSLPPSLPPSPSSLSTTKLHINHNHAHAKCKYVLLPSRPPSLPPSLPPLTPPPPPHMPRAVRPSCRSPSTKRGGRTRKGGRKGGMSYA